MTCHFPKAFPIKSNTGYGLSLLCRLRHSPKGPAPLALWGDLPKEAMLEMQFKSDSHLELQGNPYAPVTDMFQDHWRSPITHPWYIIWEGKKADSFNFQMSDTLLLLLILLSLNYHYHWLAQNLCVDQAGLKLAMILLSLATMCWHCRYMLPCLT